MDTLKTIRPELLTLSQEQIQALIPYFWVFGGCVISILGCVLRFISPKWPVFVIMVATCVAAIISSLDLLHLNSVSLFNDMMVSDTYSNFFNIVFLASAGFTALISFR